MDEYVIKQKIQNAFSEPRAPEDLVQRVILRAKAVTMGAQAQKQLETASEAERGELASRALIGQLATVSELPMGMQPEELAHQLEEQPAFQAALRGGNLPQRLKSGELLRQITGHTPDVQPEEPQISNPQKDGPAKG